MQYIRLILLCSCLLGVICAQAQTTGQLLDSAAYYKGNDFTKAVQFAEAAYQKALAAGDKATAAKAGLTAGISSYLSGNHDQALEWYLLTEQLYLESEDHAGLAATYNEMIVFYSRHQKFEAGNETGRKAIREAAIAGDTLLLANAYNNTGLLLFRQEMSDSALLHLKKAYSLYRQAKDAVGMSYSLDYMASVLSGKGDKQTALAYLKQSRELKRQTPDSMGEAMIINNIGEALLEQKDYSGALAYFREARGKAGRLKFDDLEAHTWLMEAEASAGLKDFAGAYAAAGKYQEIHEKVLNEKRVRAIEELQTKYETRKKEQENLLLQQQNQVQALHLRQRNIIIIALFIMSLLTAGISYLLYTRSRLKQKAKLSETLRHQQELRTRAVIETEEHERQRLARELHDGIGQMLAATRQSLERTSVSRSTPEPGLPDHGSPPSALKLIDESIRELRLLSHQMMPPSLRNKNLVEALAELLDRTAQSTTINIQTSWSGMENLQLDTAQTLMLYRTIQEIISNTIRHAGAANLQIELVRHDTELSLMIYDDGKGFDVEATEQSAGGLGLKNIRSRIAFIGGALEIDSTPGKGATFIINIPLDKN